MSQQSIAAVTYVQLLVPEVFAITAHSGLRHCNIIFFSFLIKQGLEFHIFLSMFFQSSYVHSLPPTSAFPGKLQSAGKHRSHCKAQSKS